MNNQRLYKIGWLAGLLFVWGTFIVIAQTTIDPPTLLSVSVSPDDGKVTAKWSSSATTDIDGYYVYRCIRTGTAQGGYQHWTAPNALATELTFTFDSAALKPIPFFVNAYKVVGSNENKSQYKNIHQTIFTSLAYDSCLATITVSWTGYEGWGSDLANYRVFRYENGTKTDISDALPSTTNSYVVSGIKGGADYSYYVQADNSAGLGSVTSNKANRHTFLEQVPQYLNALNANFREPSFVDLAFAIDASTDITQFQLEASSDVSGTYSTIQKFNLSHPSGITTTDTLTSRSPRYYKLEAMNSCKQRAETSNLSTALIAKCTMDQNKALVTWNAYKEYTGGLWQYNIFRTVGSSNSQLIASVGAGNTSYSDDVFALAGQQLSGSICYQIEAESLPSQSGTTYKSISATACIDLSENVFIPQAFTPNRDGQNDEFKPFFAFEPNQYHLWIYDRSGILLFDSSDSSKGWNGDLGNAKNATPGVYVYFLKFVSNQGKIVEKKGAFTLIYP